MGGLKRFAEIAIAIGACVMGVSGLAAEKPGFEVRTGESPWGITSLKCGAKPDLEFVRPGSALGDVAIRCRTAAEGWREFKSGGALTTCDVGVSKLELTQEFEQANERLVWGLTLKNAGAADIEVGDLALSLPMYNNYSKNTEETFERRVFRHAFIGGEGSWVYWQPAGGGGPYLLMSACRGTGLEFFSINAFDYAWGGGVGFPAPAGGQRVEPRYPGDFPQTLAGGR